MTAAWFEIDPEADRMPEPLQERYRVQDPWCDLARVGEVIPITFTGTTRYGRALVTGHTDQGQAVVLPLDPALVLIHSPSSSPATTARSWPPWPSCGSATTTRCSTSPTGAVSSGPSIGPGTSPPTTSPSTAWTSATCPKTTPLWTWWCSTRPTSPRAGGKPAPSPGSRRATTRTSAPATGSSSATCMDYVNGSRYIQGRHHVVTTAAGLGLRQVDEFVHYSGVGPQPARDVQYHSRRAHSFLCVFRKPARWRAGR